MIQWDLGGPDGGILLWLYFRDNVVVHAYSGMLQRCGERDNAHAIQQLAMAALLVAIALERGCLAEYALQSVFNSIATFLHNKPHSGSINYKGIRQAAL